MMPFLTLVFTQKGLSATETGLILGWQFMVGFASRPGVAALGDKYHKHKQLLLLCSILSVCFMSAIWWVPSREHKGRYETKLMFTCSRDTEHDTKVSCFEENGTAVLTTYAGKHQF